MWVASRRVVTTIYFVFETIFMTFMIESIVLLLPLHRNVLAAYKSRLLVASP